jgi:hypothetical protein
MAQAALTFVSMVTSPSEAMASATFQLFIFGVCWRVLTLNGLLETGQLAEVFWSVVGKVEFRKEYKFCDTWCMVGQI